MVRIKTEKINLNQVPMRQRKYIGQLCQRHMESKENPGRVETLCDILKNYIDTHTEPETTAARWVLARLATDPLSESNCRLYINELLYG